MIAWASTMAGSGLGGCCTGHSAWVGPGGFYVARGCETVPLGEAFLFW